MSKYKVILSREVEADTEQGARYAFADMVCEGDFDTRSLAVEPVPEG